MTWRVDRHHASWILMLHPLFRSDDRSVLPFVIHSLACYCWVRTILLSSVCVVWLCVSFVTIAFVCCNASVFGVVDFMFEYAHRDTLLEVPRVLRSAWIVFLCTVDVLGKLYCLWTRFLPSALFVVKAQLVVVRHKLHGDQMFSGECCFHWCSELQICLHIWLLSQCSCLGTMCCWSPLPFCSVAQFAPEWEVETLFL